MSAEKLLKETLHFTNPEVIRRVCLSSKIKCLPKGEKLIEVGEVQTFLPVLMGGVLRGFVIDAGGRDITDCFAYRAGDIAVGCNALEDPSQITIEAIVDTKLLMIPLPVVAELMEDFPEMMQFYVNCLQRALNEHWEGKMLMHRFSAMQRYCWFLKEYPGLVNSISSKHVASFLGMTPVTLSRLRRQLKNMPNA